jgi:hypothetical protein
MDVFFTLKVEYFSFMYFILWCDNIGATYLSHNIVFHEKIDIHFIIFHEKVIRKDMKVQLICSAGHIVHVFTNFNISVSLLKNKLHIET